MDDDRKPHPSRPVPALESILARVEAAERSALRDMIGALVDAAQRVDISDVWENGEGASSYWILFMSGVDQEDEMSYAKELLVWVGLFAKSSARAACIQSSDRKVFRYCTKHFGLKRWPTLVLSDRPDMSRFISIEGTLLATLAERRGGIRRLFTELHALIEAGQSFDEVSRTISTERFWKHLKVAYAEVKTLIAVSIKAGPASIEGGK